MGEKSTKILEEGRKIKMKKNICEPKFDDKLHRNFKV